MEEGTDDTLAYDGDVAGRGGHCDPQARFKSLFPDGLIILNGGMESGTLHTGTWTVCT